jgi:hypothetical protein
MQAEMRRILESAVNPTARVKLDQKRNANLANSDIDAEPGLLARRSIAKRLC